MWNYILFLKLGPLINRNMQQVEERNVGRHLNYFKVLDTITTFIVICLFTKSPKCGVHVYENAFMLTYIRQ